MENLPRIAQLTSGRSGGGSPVCLPPTCMFLPILRVRPGWHGAMHPGNSDRSLFCYCISCLQWPLGPWAWGLSVCLFEHPTLPFALLLSQRMSLSRGAGEGSFFAEYGWFF